MSIMYVHANCQDATVYTKKVTREEVDFLTKPRMLCLPATSGLSNWNDLMQDPYTHLCSLRQTVRQTGKHYFKQKNYIHNRKTSDRQTDSGRPDRLTDTRNCVNNCIDSYCYYHMIIIHRIFIQIRLSANESKPIRNRLPYWNHFYSRVFYLDFITFTVNRDVQKKKYTFSTCK